MRPTPRTDAVMQDPLRDGNDLPELARQLENELSEALREHFAALKENKKLKEALIRVRTWGISSKNFSATDSYKMAEWIDNGCAGELPKPDGPWIYEKMGGII